MTRKIKINRKTSPKGNVHLDLEVTALIKQKARKRRDLNAHSDSDPITMTTTMLTVMIIMDTTIMMVTS